MKSRLSGIPVYESRLARISADHYNLVRVALKRLGSPIRIELPKLRGLDLLLDEETWIVLDRDLNEVPVLAWLNFDYLDRSLHEPVGCLLNFYHAHAGIIIDKILEAMSLILGEMLSEACPDLAAEVVDIKKKS